MSTDDPRTDGPPCAACGETLPWWFDDPESPHRICPTCGQVNPRDHEFTLLEERELEFSGQVSLKWTFCLWNWHFHLFGDEDSIAERLGAEAELYLVCIEIAH